MLLYLKMQDWLQLGFGEACLDMDPHESHVNSIDLLHMGRSEAPLTRDSQEGIPGRTNRKQPTGRPSKIAFKQETLGGQKAERICGVEYKYNEQGTAPSV